MKLLAVSVADVTRAWVEVLPLMQRIADSAPDLTLADLWRNLRSGDDELWLVGTPETGHEAAAITRLREWDGGVAAVVIGVASNDQRRWQQIIPEWRAALKARGADRIIIEGRKGWQRVFRDATLLRQTYEARL
jgi:hypothetical protein